MEYEENDVVTYRPFGGGSRVIRVVNKEEDIKNGFPGFDGVDLSGEQTYWGYDSQIIKVQKGS